MLLIDAHQDLAWNMATFGRDYSLSAAETRQRERNTETPARNGDTLLGWPDFQRGRLAVIFATLFAAPARARTGEWDTQCYLTFDQAHALYRAQLDSYDRLCDAHPGKFRLIHAKGDLREVVEGWEGFSPSPVGALPTGEGRGGGVPVGLAILMEGAEAVRAPAELEDWWRLGVRIIGPAWAGTRFCGGSHEPGPLTKDGYALLEGMAAIGFALDLSHMDEKAALQALEAYPGAIIASHSNAAALLKGYNGNRMLSDRLLRGLIERDGVVGVVPFNRFLWPGWQPSDGREAVTLRHVVAQIDYICQMAGDARHVGLGSDYDGGYGLQHVPAEVDTIADLQKLAPLLAEKGYTEADIAAILGTSWLDFLEKILPETL